MYGKTEKQIMDTDKITQSTEWKLENLIGLCFLTLE